MDLLALQRMRQHASANIGPAPTTTMLHAMPPHLTSSMPSTFAFAPGPTTQQHVRPANPHFQNQHVLAAVHAQALAQAQLDQAQAQVHHAQAQFNLVQTGSPRLQAQIDQVRAGSPLLQAQVNQLRAGSPLLQGQGQAWYDQQQVTQADVLAKLGLLADRNKAYAQIQAHAQVQARPSLQQTAQLANHLQYAQPHLQLTQQAAPPVQPAAQAPLPAT
jgi:hypothetical protein